MKSACMYVLLAIALIIVPSASSSHPEVNSKSTAGYECKASDIVGPWLIYRRETNELKSHISKQTLNIRETDAVGKFRVTGSLIGEVGADWNGECEASAEFKGLYVVRGSVKNHECDHEVAIFRGDGHAGNYAEDCDDLVGGEKRLCKILSNLLFSKHILVTFPDHDKKACSVLDPGHHGGSAHGGSN